MLKAFLIWFFIISISVFKTYGQERILEFTTKYEDTPFIMQNSFTLVNETTNDLTVFLTKKSDISAYHFNDSLEIQGRLLSRQLPNKYKIPLGGTIDKSKYTLFYSNVDKSRFAGIVFDFETRWSNMFELNLKLKNEILLTQFNHTNKLHLLTASYRENHLYLYILDNAGSSIKKTIDLSQFEFLGGANYPTRLKHALALGAAIGPQTNVQWIQNGMDYSLDSLISWYKLYIEEDILFLTIDINRNNTQVITYDLKNDVVDFIKIKQPEFKNEAKSSSYMLHGKLFQLKVNSREMSLRISEIASGKILKEHHITKEDSLDISLGPIHQRGGRYNNYREFEKTSTFLRKVNNSYPALFVKNLEGSYQLNIGSVQEIDNTLVRALAAINPLPIVYAFGNITLMVNPVVLAFYKVANSKAVYIFSLMDSDFEIMQGNEPQSIFYRIHDYIQQEGLKRFIAADIFKYRGNYIFGRLDRKTWNYSLLEFKTDN